MAKIKIPAFFSFLAFNLIFSSSVFASIYCWGEHYKDKGISYIPKEGGYTKLYRTFKEIADNFATDYPKYRGRSRHISDIRNRVNYKLEYGSKAEIEGKEIKCKFTSNTEKQVTAKCDDLILSSQARSSKDWPKHWMPGILYSLAQYNGQTYFVINGVNPISQTSYNVWRSSPALVINPQEKIYGMNCLSDASTIRVRDVNNFKVLVDGGIESTYVHDGYGNGSLYNKGYLGGCIQRSVCTKKGTFTKVNELTYLVPIKYGPTFLKSLDSKYQGFISKSNPSVDKDTKYIENLKKFFNREDVIALNMEYTILAPTEKKELGF